MLPREEGVVEDVTFRKSQRRPSGDNGSLSRHVLRTNFSQFAHAWWACWAESGVMGVRYRSGFRSAFKLMETWRFVVKFPLFAFAGCLPISLLIRNPSLSRNSEAAAKDLPTGHFLFGQYFFLCTKVTMISSVSSTECVYFAKNS